MTIKPSGPGPGETEEELTDSDNEVAIGFSFDLEDRCVKHFEFLKTLHDAGITKHVTQESLQRYLLWLNMLAKMHSKSSPALATLVPPMDVAWLWHCHRLAPAKYEEFLQATCMAAMTVTVGSSHNSLMDWKDPANDAYILVADSIARNLWSKYNPDEPFDLDPLRNVSVAKVLSASSNKLLCGFDLLASAKSQAEFYWQIQSLFEWSSKLGGYKATFDTTCAHKNYCRFLNLFRKNPNLPYKLVPTIEIDLMWHTHMTGGTMFQYHSDCEVITGKLFDHDDAYGDGDRSFEGILNEAFQKTAHLWSTTFKDDTYASRGGYRGPPPHDYFPAAAVAEPVEDYVGKGEKGDDSEESKTKNRRRFLLGCCIVCLLLGVVLVVMGVAMFLPVGYVCGAEPPSRQEIESRGAPVCLQASVTDGFMCLRAGEDPRSPAAWCQENLAEIEDFYLWWSPCTKCGAAWRMHWERTDDQSSFKYLESDMPEPNELPPSDNGWTQWVVELEAWKSTDLWIEECAQDRYSVDENGIPEVCYAEKTAVALWAPGVTLVILSMAGLLVWLCSVIGCASRTAERRNSHYYGGGCGGGGGGGGGGGCGGC